MKDARITIPRSEYDRRIQAVQRKMQEQDIDLLITHACECESATVRYLTNFWAVFDFVGVVIPQNGKPVLLTGGPESYDFAVQFAQIDDIRVHPMYVETSAPEWDKPTDSWDYTKLFADRGFAPKRIGIANPHTIPHMIMEDIKKAAPNAVFVNCEELIMHLRWYKSDIEIEVLKEAYRITENAVKKAVDFIEPGVREWEIEAAWRADIYQNGAEGTGYPCWVTSGDATYQSLCKSTDAQITNNSMVQLSLGAKYNGYCGNLCRAIVLGDLPEKHMNMIQVSLECVEETISMMRPGVVFADIYNKFQARLESNGFHGLNLYGPAHGTGLQECEGPWVDHRGELVMAPNMVFNIDVWIADETCGVRIEDGVLITEQGREELSNWRREIIRK